jgi:hypothetical protein
LFSPTKLASKHDPPLFLMTNCSEKKYDVAMESPKASANAATTSTLGSLIEARAAVMSAEQPAL